MGIIKGLLILTANMALVIIMIRFITLALEKTGIFKAMERLFGKRDNQVVHEVKDYQVSDADDENDDNLG